MASEALESIAFNAPVIDITIVDPEARNDAEIAARLEAEKRQAYERGRQEGEQVMNDQIIQQRNMFHELENGLLTNLRKVVTDVREGCEQALVELSLEVAQRIVGSIPVSVETVEAAIRETLSEAEDSTHLRVEVNPEDYALLKESDSPCLAHRDVEIEASDEVTRGGCVVHTRFGVVDGTREKRFLRIRNAILSK